MCRTIMKAASCFEQLYLMIVLTTNNETMGILCMGDLK